jgi:hypothetical protein
MGAWMNPEIKWEKTSNTEVDRTESIRKQGRKSFVHSH